MAGFKYSHRLSGGTPTIIEIVSSDATLNVGDLVNVESQKLDLAVTNDTALLGAVMAPGDPLLADGDTISGMDTTTDTVFVCVDPDAVYSVVDNNARKLGDVLDITGGTGAQSVGAPTNNDLVVVAPSTASQKTKVMISQINHAIAGK